MLSYCYATCKKDEIRKLAGMTDNNRNVVNRVWTPLNPQTGVREHAPGGYSQDKEAWKAANPMPTRPQPPF